MDDERDFSEASVGITEFITDGDGFYGIIKQRYSDFLVHEIDEHGQKVDLTCTDVPASDVEAVKTDPSLISESQHEALRAVCNATSGETSFEVTYDKDTRRTLHHTLRELYPELTCSTETNDGNGTLIKAIYKPFRNERKRSHWPKHRGDHCWFTMYKENCGTMEVITKLARLLHVPPKAFGYAGTKDRRAKTSQLVSVHRVEASRLASLNKLGTNVTLGNFMYKKEEVHLGQLRGNAFTVVVRSVQGDMEQVKRRIDLLKSSGFVNYYGSQRFGTWSVPTHHIGLAMLLGKWQEVVGLILKPRGDGDDAFAKCCSIWANTRDAKKALSRISHTNRIEKLLLEGLVRGGGKNYRQALQKIPKQMRWLYLHSYQSYIWNKVASKRIREYGLTPVKGDLILRSRHCDLENSMHGSEKPKFKPDVFVGQDASSVTNTQNVPAASVRIEDVVLPLPGFEIQFPENEVGSYYGEFLAEDSLTLDHFPRQGNEYALPGAYRRIVAIPGDFSSFFTRYDDPLVALVKSDRDFLLEKRAVLESGALGMDRQATSAGMDGLPLPAQQNSGQHVGLVLHFSLPVCSYATMALRELMKMDTSSAHQATLTERAAVKDQKPDECD